MKKYAVLTVLLAVFRGPVSLPAAEPSAPPHVALIDVGYVFQNYERFKDARSTLQTQASASRQQLVQEAQGLKALQGQLQQLEQGSTAHQQSEDKAISLATNLKAKQQIVQRDLTRKESQLYKEIYLEIQEATGKYASYYKYSLVLKFSRDDITEAESPQNVMQGLNRQVVYHRPQDDISDAVLDFLNRQYRKPNEQSSPEKTAKQQPTR